MPPKKRHRRYRRSVVIILYCSLFALNSWSRIENELLKAMKLSYKFLPVRGHISHVFSTERRDTYHCTSHLKVHDNNVTVSVAVVVLTIIEAIIY